VLFIGFLLVFLPGQILQSGGITRPSSIGVAQIAGATLVILGASLAIWCILAFALVGRGTPAPFDPPRRLVVSGPYRFVRNPMYIGAALALCGAGLFYRSTVLIGYALLFLVVLGVFVHWYEEPTLRRMFGAEYEAYCREVRRWWPVRARVHVRTPFGSTIVRLLRGVASGEIDGEQAMQALLKHESEIAGHRLYEDAWAHIQHFVADTDIRDRESSYDRTRRTEMQRLAERISSEEERNE
jgi:protein-S-isoprenylcysteine O-methyltransferase Ste14